MNLKDVIAKITVKPIADKKVNITVTMPIWLRRNHNKIYITFPLFGGINTFVENESEIDTASQELVESFFIAASKFGKGIPTELSTLGWEQKKNNHRFRTTRKRLDRRTPVSSTSFVPPNASKLPMFQNLMNTGVKKQFSLQV